MSVCEREKGDRERDGERRGLLKKKRLKIKPGMASGWNSENK